MSLLSKIITLGIIVSRISPKLKSLLSKKANPRDDEESIEEASEQALLKEYEACQSHNNSLGQQAWVSISIIITVNTLVIVQVIYNLLLTSYPINGYFRLILVIAIAISMLFILEAFRRWDKRIDFQVLLNNERMRQIETALEMWKNWRVYGLDIFTRRIRNDRLAQEEWQLLNQNQREYIQSLHQRLQEKAQQSDLWRYREPTTKRNIFMFDNIIPSLMIFWGIVIFMEITIYFWPFMQKVLFN